ncbi:MAG TPA: Wadjet anti-phage system protein JetD domain-containing protein, partial [Arthrobacter sp.]
RRRALKRPAAAALLSAFPAVQRWAAELFAGAGPYTLETVEMGRRTVGSNRIPAAAVFAAVEDEIGFAGKSRESARFRELASGLGALDPLLLGWAARRPLKLLELGADALTAARAALWLRDNPAPGIYVRQLGLPGVHTKFIERHRQVIDQLLTTLRSGSTVIETDADAEDSAEVTGPDVAESDAALEQGAGRTPAARFARRHGFLHPPELVRFRILDPGIPALGAARDITVTAETFSTLQLPVHTVIATENQVNFLALPERPGALALYGGGYGFSSLRDAAWLRECEVLYWGDIDTHGFRILDQLRAAHPHVVSVLMDEETLLAHRDGWGQEPSPSRAELTRLTPAELALYEALGNDAYGSAVRLEQELIRWDWALARLAVRPRGR